MIGKPNSKAILISALNTYAEPLHFLDYLLHDIQPAIIVARAGILVNVPSPARYVLHKLVASIRRPAAMQTKTLKDVEQAKLLLKVNDLRRIKLIIIQDNSLLKFTNYQ